MASGCILGECKVCGEHVYEDEGDHVGIAGILQHNDCRTLAQQKIELKQLREQVAEYKKWLG